MFKTPSIENIKKPEISSEIVLRFFRHSEKESKVTIDPEDGKERAKDYKIRLTPRGRDLASAKNEGHIEHALAYGSPRDRARETAGIIMSGHNFDSLENLEEELMAEHKLDSKLEQTRIGTDKRLDFNDDDTTPYGKRFYDEFVKGNYIPFIFQDSDSYAKEVGDAEGSTYSRMAAGVAQIIKKYYQASDGWNSLKQSKPDIYGEDENLNRILVSHAGVGESFLGKLMEKTRGVEERDRFAEMLKKKGFDFVEGFDVHIKQRGSEKAIDVSYRKKLDDGQEYTFEEEVPEAMLEEIIAEGEK